MSQSLLAALIKRLPYGMQGLILRLLYLKSRQSLQDFKVFLDGQFYAFKLKEIYVPSDSLGWFVNYDYYYDWVSSVSAYAYKPAPGDIVIDIGAGLGEETIVFSKMTGNNGKVYSMEANPEVYKVLQSIVALNRLDNVYLFNKAISNGCNLVDITVGNTFLGGSIGGDVNKGGKSFQVPGIGLDRFMEENSIREVHLLKVNIEGAERFVVETMDAVVDRIKNVAIACHDFRYETENENNLFFKTKELVASYLMSKGFVLRSQTTGKRYIDDWIYGSK